MRSCPASVHASCPASRRSSRLRARTQRVEHLAARVRVSDLVHQNSIVPDLFELHDRCAAQSMLPSKGTRWSSRDAGCRECGSSRDTRKRFRSPRPRLRACARGRRPCRCRCPAPSRSCSSSSTSAARSTASLSITSSASVHAERLRHRDERPRCCESPPRGCCRRRLDAATSGTPRCSTKYLNGICSRDLERRVHFVAASPARACVARRGGVGAAPLVVDERIDDGRVDRMSSSSASRSHWRSD